MRNLTESRTPLVVFEKKHQADDRGTKEQAASPPSASALRSGAELAVSKGEHEKAIRLFSQVGCAVRCDAAQPAIWAASDG